VTSDAIRCYELDDTVAGNTQIATVSAGDTVGFKANGAIYHPGVSLQSLDARQKLSVVVRVVSIGIHVTGFPGCELCRCWT
jgi:hypothetical protein